MLNTIILNWNRVELLRQCVDSYLATVGDDYELTIIDNASTDGSGDYLRRLEASRPVRVVYLHENLGGEAFNLVTPTTRGELVHLSENDQVFLPGWRAHAEAAFAAFPELGQLSLFSDTPTDDEAWEAKPSRLRFSGGKILYEAPDNIGTSSIIRGELLRERGIRVANVEQIRLRLPDDGKLSRDVRGAGYWCAFSDRYYVRNVGHETAEFERDPAYYTENYANKPLTGVSGWRARIEQHDTRPQVHRDSLVFPEREPIPERTPQPVNGVPARLWSMYDVNSAESEVLDLLMVLTRLVKPAHVIETGTWLGLSACAIARGLVANGFGDLTTLEIDPQIHQAASDNIESCGFGEVVDARLCSSLDFTPDRTYDMAVFDSEMHLLADEFWRLRPSLKDGATVVFHDSAPHCQAVIAAIIGLLKAGAVHGVNFATPRGVFVGRVAYTTGA
ncbi:MAG TPA: class I SAM-dependent methyltransferase [Stellaceae bacterium]|jgi:predicted O-methyltransferase YrrM|nr:class I SAM-dependent methyltransferase [Stellaceae bacterium]